MACWSCAPNVDTDAEVIGAPKAEYTGDKQMQFLGDSEKTGGLQQRMTGPVFIMSDLDGDDVSIALRGNALVVHPVGKEEDFIEITQVVACHSTEDDSFSGMSSDEWIFMLVLSVEPVFGFHCLQCGDCLKIGPSWYHKKGDDSIEDCCSACWEHVDDKDDYVNFLDTTSFEKFIENFVRDPVEFKDLYNLRNSDNRCTMSPPDDWTDNKTAEFEQQCKKAMVKWDIVNSESELEACLPSQNWNLPEHGLSRWIESELEPARTWTESVLSWLY